MSQKKDQKLDEYDYCTIFIHVVPNPNPKLKNNTHCVYAIGFRRTTMLEYIYNGHSIAYDPISGEET